MNLQSVTSEFSSEELRVPRVKATGTALSCPKIAVGSRVDPHETNPDASPIGGDPPSGMPPGLHWSSSWVLGSAPGTEARSAMVTDAGTAGVTVLLIKSFLT